MGWGKGVGGGWKVEEGRVEEGSVENGMGEWEEGRGSGWRLKVQEQGEGIWGQGKKTKV